MAEGQPPGPLAEFPPRDVPRIRERLVPGLSPRPRPGLALFFQILGLFLRNVRPPQQVTCIDSLAA